ncbi:hypothetical protein ADUPG1_006152 [Aduncisulcus paluster]|uniref:Uncharacterized protein n=1 Tax=Aduncisulcus paluster TaxID=2918883 RepID=A0ABQ5KGZ7_9EUKA|nr:hypothetical protein ADUPG1_006152 [Aduncisulcus paluster]|eukprot:gnl/Carplike_NY0171/1188_a1606_1381.p1 GENE.gnl/Carplike_NY0171/1188_a1606_1381~~gnl/Carplike_NY0171/1188_a1606_1381.p1  ORF type:complete len:363 (+),score=66.95 gnl/Carplike_NY0171/1188_a1606_1381:15-1103(+)
MSGKVCSLALLLIAIVCGIAGGILLWQGYDGVYYSRMDDFHESMLGFEDQPNDVTADLPKMQWLFTFGDYYSSDYVSDDWYTRGHDVTEIDSNSCKYTMSRLDYDNYTSKYGGVGNTFGYYETIAGKACSYSYNLTQQIEPNVETFLYIEYHDDNGGGMTNADYSTWTRTIPQYNNSYESYTYYSAGDCSYDYGAYCFGGYDYYWAADTCVFIEWPVSVLISYSHDSLENNNHGVPGNSENDGVLTSNMVFNDPDGTQNEIMAAYGCGSISAFPTCSTDLYVFQENDPCFNYMLDYPNGFGADPDGLVVWGWVCVSVAGLALLLSLVSCCAAKKKKQEQGYAPLITPQPVPNIPPGRGIYAI